MGTRLVLSGVAGGFAMFVWMSIAHVVLPLGETGVQEITDEQPVLTALHTTLGDRSGLFLFPSTGAGANATQQQKNAALKEYDQKLLANPSGLQVYHPPGETGLTARRLLIEFLTEIMEALLVVFLLSQTQLTGLGRRVAFVTISGVLVSLGTNVSYWNWYGFPSNYTLVYMFNQVVAFFFAGIVAAAILGKRVHKLVAVPA